MILKVNYNKKTHLISTHDKPKFDDIKRSIAQTFKSLPARYAISYTDEDGDQIALQNQQDYQVLLSSIQKTIKINIKEVNQDLVEFTEKIDIQQKIDEIKESIKDVQPQSQKLDQVQKNMDSNIVDLDQGIIGEKLKKMMPEIISKIKSQISQQLIQRSRLSDQPPIAQESPEIKQVQKSFVKGKIPQHIKKSENSLVIHQGVKCDNCQKKDIRGIRYKCSVCANYDFCQECQAFVEHPHSFLKIRHPRQVPIKIYTVVNDEENKLELNGQQLNVHQRFQLFGENGLNFIQNYLYQNSSSNQKVQTSGNQNSCLQKNCEKTNVQTQMKPQKREIQKKEVSEVEFMKPKQEEKNQIKKKAVFIEKQLCKEAPQKIDEKKVMSNAQYLASFGFQFGKCYQWASIYHKLSKEELLQFCLNQVKFLN